MTKGQIIEITKDIRFWILVFFLIRLFGITDAPLEMGHNWRQSMTNMIARNFLEVSPNMFYPRIDIAGDYTGILGSEFPVFSYLIFLLAKIFGYDHWYGRMISLIVSSISIYYLYLLVKKYFKKEVAFYAAMLLSLSIWFSFSRKSMPDVFSVSLVIIGIYYCIRYLETGKLFKLILFFLLTTIGTLSKIPAALLLATLAIPLFASYPLNRKIGMVASGVVTIGFVSLWYFYWVPHLVDTYHYKLFFPRGLLEGFLEIIALPFDTLDKFVFTSFYSFVGFTAFLGGLVLMFVKKNLLLIKIFGITSAVFFVFILKTGYVFSLHNYYIIPYIPVMALVAAYGITFLKIKMQYLLLLAICIESVANQSYDFRIKPQEEYKLSLENAVDGIIGMDDLIIVNGNYSPQTMYFLHRKGWTVKNETLKNPATIKARIKSGAKYLVVDKHHLDKTFDFQMAHEDTNIIVYTLK